MEKKLGNKQLLKQVAQLTDKYDNSKQLNEAYGKRIKDLEHSVADAAHNVASLNELNTKYYSKIGSLEKTVASLTAEKVQLSTQVDEGIEVKTRLNNRIMRLEDELLSSHRELSKQRNEFELLILNQSEQLEAVEKQRDIYHKAWKSSSVKTYMACGLAMFVSLCLIGQGLWQMYSGS